MPETLSSPIAAISVVICTRNRPQDVALCLPTILACDYPNFEVVLVDQSTNDDTQAQIQALETGFSRLVYHRAATVGKSLALDLGIALAQIETLAFTDDDCEVSPDWLRQIANAFAADDRVDILFGPVLPSPALNGLGDICVPSWAFTEARDLFPGEVCGMGANMALRRRALARLPGSRLFDPILGPGCPFPAGEEGDFVYRLRRAGAVAALRPALTLYHRAFRTREHWVKVMEGYGLGDAAFHLKHLRCGDLWAARAICRTLTYYGPRSLVHLLRGRPGSLAFLRGYCRGLALSRRYAIDRSQRLYRLPDAARPERGLLLKSCR